MTAGALLREAREARGLTLGDAAVHTRLREPYLAALEEDELQRLPAPVYARGYLRTYAAYLDLDADALLAAQRPGLREPDRVLAPSRRGLPEWALNLTPGLALTAAVLATLGGLGLYAHHELTLDQAPPSRPAPIVIASPPSGDVRSASAGPRRPNPLVATEVTVSLRFTDKVWVYVEVDGKPVYGAQGRFFGAGDVVSFTGKKVTVTSGKGAATIVGVNGVSKGPLPDGVTTREYTAQT